MCISELGKAIEQRALCFQALRDIERHEEQFSKAYHFVDRAALKQHKRSLQIKIDTNDNLIKTLSIKEPA